MKAVITLVTIVCGTVLMLSPALFTQAMDSQFFIWAQIVGGGMCSSGVAMAFMLVSRSDAPTSGRAVAP